MTRPSARIDLDETPSGVAAIGELPDESQRGTTVTRYYIDPATGQRVEIQKSHKVRNFVVFPAIGFFALITVAAVATSGGEVPAQSTTPTVVPAAPGTSPEAPAGSTLEVFGDGEAMLTVMTNGTSTNTVQLPHTQELPEGYVMVSVSRTPSVESYMENGGPDSGSVSCRITRDGDVVEEQTANGEFASVSCSKFR